MSAWAIFVGRHWKCDAALYGMTSVLFDGLALALPVLQTSHCSLAFASRSRTVIRQRRCTALLLKTGNDAAFRGVTESLNEHRKAA
jgi:hypothetical protein